MKYKFYIPKEKTVSANSLEELVDKFIKSDGLRLDIDLDDCNITIINNTINGGDYEVGIETLEVSYDRFDYSSFDDIIEIVSSDKMLIESINKEFPKGLFR